MPPSGPLVEMYGKNGSENSQNSAKNALDVSYRGHTPYCAAYQQPFS